jgi:perosamine synthetase
MKRTIPLSEPFINGNEWKYVKDCLDTGWVSSVGSYVSRFEELVASYLGTESAIATVNGTSALHISLLACGVQNGDEVIVPTLTFIAPVNTVRYCGAEPIFMDCDPQTLCIDVGKAIAFIKNHTTLKKDGFTYNNNTRRRIKAIIPVHIFGHPVDMDDLIDVCAKRKITPVEDATESVGSEYKGRKTGVLGLLGCLSFNGNKIITTGGGGMVVTKDKNLGEKIRHLTTQAKRDPIEHDHDAIGYNYRLTNIQAAVGVAQMERIDEYKKKKRRNALLYKNLFSKLEGVEFLWEKPWANSNFWFYTIKVPKKYKLSLMNYLVTNNIQVRPIWKLIHTLPMYRNCQIFEIHHAMEAYDRCINLPCSVNLAEEDLKYVVEKVKEFFHNI